MFPNPTKITIWPWDDRPAEIGDSLVCGGDEDFLIYIPLQYTEDEAILIYLEH